MNVILNFFLFLYISCILFKSVVGKNNDPHKLLLNNLYQRPLSQYWNKQSALKSEIPTSLLTNSRGKNHDKNKKVETANSTNYKRWGPKFVIIESIKQPNFIRPHLDKNSQILQYNYGNPGEEVPTYSFSYRKQPSVSKALEDSKRQWQTMLPEKNAIKSRILDKGHYNRYEENSDSLAYAHSLEDQQGFKTINRYAENDNKPKTNFFPQQQNGHRRIMTPEKSEEELATSFLDPSSYKRNGRENTSTFKSPIFRELDLSKNLKSNMDNPHLKINVAENKIFNVPHQLKPKLSDLNNAEKKTVKNYPESGHYLPEKSSNFFPETKISNSISDLFKETGSIRSVPSDVYPNADRMDEPQYQSTESDPSNESKNKNNEETNVQSKLIKPLNKNFETHNNKDRFVLDEPKKNFQSSFLKDYKFEHDYKNNILFKDNSPLYNAVEHRELDRIENHSESNLNKKVEELKSQSKEQSILFSSKLKQRSHGMDNNDRNEESFLRNIPNEHKSTESSPIGNDINQSKFPIEENYIKHFIKNDKLNKKLPSLESISVESIKQQALEKNSFEHNNLLPEQEKPLIRQTSLESGEFLFNDDKKILNDEKKKSNTDKKQDNFSKTSPYELKTSEEDEDKFVKVTQEQRSTEFQYKKLKQNSTKACNRCSEKINQQGINHEHRFEQNCCEERATLAKAFENEEINPTQKAESKSFPQKSNFHEEFQAKKYSSNVESEFVVSVKENMMWFYDNLVKQAGYRVIQLYSTGCNKGDCSNSISSIKINGVELGGGVDGINIVVLDYPKYDFLYSKTYNTGFNEFESEKMVRFIEQIQSSSVVLVVSQGEATKALTVEAWKALGKLAGKSEIFVPPGGSLAFIGFKGESIFLSKEGNYQVSGDGASLVFSVIGSGNEHLTFGGSGQLYTNFIHEMIVNDTGKLLSNKDIHKVAMKIFSDAEEPSVILETIKPPSKLRVISNVSDSVSNVVEKLPDQNHLTDITNSDVTTKFKSKNKIDLKAENDYNDKSKVQLKNSVNKMISENKNKHISAADSNSLQYPSSIELNDASSNVASIGSQLSNDKEHISEENNILEERFSNRKYLIKQSKNNPQSETIMSKESQHIAEKHPNVIKDPTSFKNIFEKFSNNATDRSFEEGLLLSDDLAHSLKKVSKNNKLNQMDDFKNDIRFKNTFLGYQELNNQNSSLFEQNKEENLLKDQTNIKPNQIDILHHEAKNSESEIKLNHQKPDLKETNQVGEIHSPEEYAEHLYQGKKFSLTSNFIKNEVQSDESKILESKPFKSEVNLETPLYFLSPKDKDEISEELQDRMKEMVHKEVNETLKHFILEPRNDQESFSKEIKNVDDREEKPIVEETIEKNQKEPNSKDYKHKSNNSGEENNKEFVEVSDSTSKLNYKVIPLENQPGEKSHINKNIYHESLIKKIFEPKTELTIKSKLHERFIKKNKDLSSFTTQLQTNRIQSEKNVSVGHFKKRERLLIKKENQRNRENGNKLAQLAQLEDKIVANRLNKDNDFQISNKNTSIMNKEMEHLKEQELLNEALSKISAETEDIKKQNDSQKSIQQGTNWYSNDDLIKSLVDTSEQSYPVKVSKKTDSVNLSKSAFVSNNFHNFNDGKDSELNQDRLSSSYDCKRHKIIKNGKKSNKKHCIEKNNPSENTKNAHSIAHSNTYSTFGENLDSDENPYGANKSLFGQNQKGFMRDNDQINSVLTANNPPSAIDNSNSRRDINSNNIDASLKETEFKWKK
ncbi:uncharacterized protein LOC101237076 [Hydra vulgaris]|uniref:uncharacterized protein LOC101237076 n=1 Tax=Hydra vulgaris TaxID=6087 RepID=UPI001F5F5A94|nr:uncharacterized protein LOC101237076 [Hydra vulgaris]